MWVRLACGQIRSLFGMVYRPRALEDVIKTCCTFIVAWSGVG